MHSQLQNEWRYSQGVFLLRNLEKSNLWNFVENVGVCQGAIAFFSVSPLFACFPFFSLLVCLFVCLFLLESTPRQDVMFGAVIGTFF